MSTPKTIDEYIANEPKDIQKLLKQMRSLVRKAAPKASEKIAWGMPTFYLEGNLLHFAAFKEHLSLFPMPDTIAHFKKELAKFETSKGTVHFPYGKAIPAALLTKITKFCVKRNLAKAEEKARKKASKRKSRKPARG